MVDEICVIENCHPRQSSAGHGTSRLNSNHPSQYTDCNFLPDFGASAIPDPQSPLIEILGSGTEAIAPELLAIAATIAINTGQNEDYKALGFDFSRNWKTRKPHNYGDVLTFEGEDGVAWQFKPQLPKIGSKGKPDKYLSPTGCGSRAYLPPVTLTIWQTIADRHGVALPEWVTLEITIGKGSSRSQGFWDWVETHPQIPIVLTEGGKKSLAALSLGYVALSLYGVNAGVSKYETVGGERLRKLTPSLIPDLQRFTVPDRRFILAFDQDAAANTRRKVNAAQADLVFWLEQSGCKVQITTWDGQNGTTKGLDDLIVNAGVEAWHSAYDRAVPANEWRIGRRLAVAVKRQPNLKIGDREFSSVVDQLPRSGIVAFYGGKGTGKSEAIKLMLGKQHWLSFTSLVSLGRDQAESWGGVFINDGDQIGSQILKDGQPVQGAPVCIPSLLKVQRAESEILVLDELTATLEFLLGSKLANKEGLRPLLLAEFVRRVKAAALLLVADADLTEEAIAYIESIRGERAYLVRSDRHALTYDANLMNGSQNQAIATLLARIEALAPDQLLYLNSDSKALAESLARMLAGSGTQSLLITSDTSGGDLEAEFLTSKGACIPKLLSMGIRAIITSPTVTQGFSIKSHTDQIDSVWGFYRGGSITAHAMAQALDRVRSNNVPRFVHVAKKGNAYSKLSKAQTMTAFMKEFKQVSTAAARLVRHSLTPEAIAAADNIDWQSNNLNMLASLEVRRNQGMGALRDTLVALLRQEGKQVSMMSPSVTADEARSAGSALKAAKKQVNLAHAQAVADATPIDAIEAKRLSTQTTALTPEQVLSLEQWHLAQFYRLEKITAEDVMFDRKGATQAQIRSLEAALSHGKAIDRTATSINRNAENPQDWDKAAVRRWLLEQAGMTTLITQIVAEEIDQLTAEITQPIAQFIRDHATEFRIGFGVAKIEALPDQQIVGMLLASCGIKTRRKRRGNIYTINQDHLASLLIVLKRRQQADPHPSIINIDQGSGSVQNALPPGWTDQDVDEIRLTIAQSPEIIQYLRTTIPPEILKIAS
jgi:hypothetical protein